MQNRRGVVVGTDALLVATPENVNTSAAASGVGERRRHLRESTVPGLPLRSLEPAGRRTWYGMHEHEGALSSPLFMFSLFFGEALLLHAEDALSPAVIRQFERARTFCAHLACGRCDVTPFVSAVLGRLGASSQATQLASQLKILASLAFVVQFLLAMPEKSADMLLVKIIQRLSIAKLALDLLACFTILGSRPLSLVADARPACAKSLVGCKDMNSMRLEHESRCQQRNSQQQKCPRGTEEDICQYGCSTICNFRTTPFAVIMFLRLHRWQPCRSGDRRCDAKPGLHDRQRYPSCAKGRCPCTSREVAFRSDVVKWSKGKLNSQQLTLVCRGFNTNCSSSKQFEHKLMNADQRWPFSFSVPDDSHNLCTREHIAQL